MEHFNKGRKHSEETKRKMSLAQKGRIPHNYRKKHTEETIKKMSLVKIGKKHSEETKRKIGQAHKGRKRPKEIMDRIIKTRMSRYKRIHPGELGSKEYNKSSMLLSTYGINLKGYQKIFEQQGGKCKICGIHQSELKNSLNVDHDHETGTIRGLLCHKCNKALGLLRDNVGLVKVAYDYLFKANIDKHIHRIKKMGFTIIPKAFDADTVAHALALCKQVYEDTKDKTTENVPFLNRNQPNIYNLHNKDFFFLEMLFASEELEMVLMHFLNDKWYKQIPQDQPNYIMRSALGRSSNLVLPWHIDSFIPYVGEEAVSMQVAIILEDQYEYNGCTRVVPGSHQSGEYAPKDIPDNAYTLLNPKAGDIVVFDGRLWHGTTANYSGKSRWSILAAFCRWWVKQNFNVTGNLPKEFYDRLTPKQRSVMGYNSVPPYDEMESIDMKKGYE